MKKPVKIAASETPGGYLNPLFWMHGETEKALREEMRRMNENGIGSLIVEPRPHPDYLGDSWWRDLGIVLDEAKCLSMKIWFFDDESYPSGLAAGRIASRHPELLKVYLSERHIDCAGPLHGSSFLINEWLSDGESLIRAVAAKRTDVGDAFEAGTLTDLTSAIEDGILYWDVPEGGWRVFLFVKTWQGGEDYTRNYLNPLEPEAVQAFINEIHEEHYQHFADDFGKTIQGFFTDEPRFGNASSYYADIGRFPMVLPYSDTLLDELSAAGLGDFGRLLPCLWFNFGELSADARFVYMDAVSNRFGRNYSGMLGNWCREHGVKLIGHVVEENGAHARLGFGAGHYFRAVSGQDQAGLDIVYNIMPGFTSGSYLQTFFNTDCDFNHWGLAKMVSSAAHIDPKKHGEAMCEAFGAYGWQEGLKLMKWITDHLCVRGINRLTPHAFSPKDFPDPDCPPHFYAKGQNPQWKYFNIWSAYAQRLCGLLSGGRHVATAAVLYHAEAEWGGGYVPFEKAVKEMSLGHIDCDVVPADALCDKSLCRVHDGRVLLNGEDYSAVIVPFAEHLPKAAFERLSELAGNGVPVIFMDAFPKRCYLGGEPDVSGLRLCPSGGLAHMLRGLGLFDIETEGDAASLRFYHYRKDGKEIYFFVNESPRETVKASVSFRESGEAALCDLMAGREYRAPVDRHAGKSILPLTLAPYESLAVIFGAESRERPGRQEIKDFLNTLKIQGPWQVSTATSAEYPRFTRCDTLSGPGNAARPELLPAFSGTLRYETVFDADEVKGPALLELGAAFETAEVFINGESLGVRICPPYRFEIPAGQLSANKNRLTIDVTNTLAKAHHDNPFDKYQPQEPTGLLDEPVLYY